MRLTKKEVEILEFAKERIIDDIKDKFMLELHINGRLYENKIIDSAFGNIDIDSEIIILIDSYVSDTINKIISHTNADI